MRRYLYYMSILLALHTNVIAQKTESMQKMLDEAKSQIANDPDMDSKDREYLLKMMNNKTIKDRAKAMDQSPQMKLALQKSEKLTSLPKADSKRLSMLPPHPLNSQQLTAFINKLSIKIGTQISKEDQAKAGKMVSKAKGNSTYLSSYAVTAWYNGDATTAFYLAIKAAQLPGNINALNNLGAMLIQFGYEEKAIPVLQYALLHDSINTSIMNNLGRAYMGLGEKKKAKQYLQQCVQHTPTHPEANNSLGCLYEDAGNIQQATAHFEKSLEGSYNQNAYDHLSRLKPDFDLVPLIHKHYKAPEYFNEFGIEIPEECASVDDVQRVKAEHEAFDAALIALSDKYIEMSAQSEEQMKEDVDNDKKKLMEALEQGHSIKINTSPFSIVASHMLDGLGRNFNDASLKLKANYKSNHQALIDAYQASSLQMTERYKPLYASCRFEGEGGVNEQAKWDRIAKEECKERNDLANKTQKDLASLHSVFKDRYRRLAIDYFNNVIYWSGHVVYDKAAAYIRFYKAIDDFIAVIKYLSETTPYINYDPCNSKKKELSISNPEFKADKTAFCPFSFTIPLLIGKLSADCSSFSISGGELIKGSYKKDFSSGQSTLSIGAGLSLEAGVISAGAQESIFISFDESGKPCDAGLKMDAGISSQVGPVGTEANIGYTVDMNSGWDFTAGALGQSVNL